MSKIKELKETYPEFNIPLINSLTIVDSTKTKKYLPMICKLLKNSKLDFFKNFSKNSRLEFEEYFNKLNIDTSNLSNEELYYHFINLRHYENDIFKNIVKFIKLMENGYIENKDVLTYQTIDDVSRQISIAELKSIDKSLSKEIHKEYEDDTWCIIRPLTHQSSIRYGSSTKWCTTSINNPSTFIRYWSEGVLVYFINKKTGYKFAFYKAITYNEFGFWDAEDNRVDSLYLNIDDYLMPIIKNIISSDKANISFCSESLREKVIGECEMSDKPLTSGTELNPQINYIDEDYFLTPAVEKVSIYDGESD